MLGKMYMVTHGIITRYLINCYIFNRKIRQIQLFIILQSRKRKQEEEEEEEKKNMYAIAVYVLRLYVPHLD